MLAKSSGTVLGLADPSLAAALALPALARPGRQPRSLVVVQVEIGAQLLAVDVDVDVGYDLGPDVDHNLDLDLGNLDPAAAAL